MQNTQPVLDAVLPNSIAACVICRDNENSIVQMIESLAPGIDLLNITDTGSTDHTKELIIQTCARLKLRLHLTTFEWCNDFSKARNYNLEQLPSEYDWLFWCDSDDVVENAAKMKELVADSPKQLGGVWLPYHYAFDEYGNCITVFIRERLLRRSVGWKWQNRVHEVICAQTKTQFQKTHDVLILHKHSKQISRSERNFELLHLMLKDNPEDKRVLLYLGHQHFADQNWMEAANWYSKFASTPGIVPIEKYQALIYAAKALRSMGDYKQALGCDITALELFPQWADGYLGMAHDYFGIGDWAKCAHWAEESRTKGIPDEIIFVNPLDYTYNTNALLTDVYVKLGNLVKAIDENEQAIQIRPMPELQSNLELLKKAQRREITLKSVVALRAMLLEERELDKLGKLGDVIPEYVKELPEFSQLTNTPQINQTKSQTLSLPIGYQSRLLITDTELHTEPLESVLLKAEANADQVDLLFEHSASRVRLISQASIEPVAPAPNRNLIQLHTHADKSVHLVFDHNVNRSEHLVIRTFCGQGLEDWNPDTIESVGCGGSEIAAAWLNKELVKTGHGAMITGMASGIWDGVLYRRYLPSSFCDVIISSRVPELAVNKDIRSRLKMLWAHDTDFGPRLTPELASGFDAIVCLSKWHVRHMKRAYPWLKQAKVVDLAGSGWDETVIDTAYKVTPHYTDRKPERLPVIAIIPDGILAERFHNSMPLKTPHSFIWSSAQDRGLEELLKLWPKIREQWSDATLNIYYGWKYFDSTLWIQEQRELKQRILRLIKQPGIVWKERVNQQALAQAFMETEYWLYPPHQFRETCCITALEAQAAMVKCLYRANGALPETVGKRGKVLQLHLKEKQILDVLFNSGPHPDLVQARDWALQQTWKSVAAKWLQLINSLLKGG